MVLPIVQDSVKVQALTCTLCSPPWRPTVLTGWSLEAEHVLQRNAEQECIC